MKLNPTFPPGHLDVPTRQAERSIYQILAESGVPGHSLHNRGAHMAEPASLHRLMAPVARPRFLAHQMVLHMTTGGLSWI